MIAMPQVHAVLSKQTYQLPEISVELHRELPFALHDDNSLLSGVIDRLVVRKHGDRVMDAEVLDYKTDTVDEKSLADKVERYRPQLEAYRRAVARLLGVETDKIKTQVVFVRPGWVIDLPYPSRLTEPCS